MRREYDVACNWKVYVDNYLEGYHIPIVHPELHRELDYEQYRTELARYWSRQHAPLRPLAGAAARR
jgi:choline monooxygenase